MNVCIQKNGIDEHEHDARAGGEPVTGRRMTRRAQPLQNASLPSSLVRHGSGRRSRSTRVPTAASSAGSSVIDASTEMQTTTIAPTAIERSALTSIAKSAASDTATVAPLKTTAVPELVIARASACVLCPRPHAARGGSG